MQPIEDIFFNKRIYQLNKNQIIYVLKEKPYLLSKNSSFSYISIDFKRVMNRSWPQ